MSGWVGNWPTRDSLPLTGGPTLDDHDDLTNTLIAWYNAPHLSRIADRTEATAAPVVTLRIITAHDHDGADHDADHHGGAVVDFGVPLDQGVDGEQTRVLAAVRVAADSKF